MMKLWYNNTATEWTEALSIGNGHMGAMCYGGDEESARLFDGKILKRVLQ